VKEDPWRWRVHFPFVAGPYVWNPVRFGAGSSSRPRCLFFLSNRKKSEKRNTTLLPHRSLALLTRLSAFSRSALLLWIGALARVRAPDFKFMKTMRILFPIQKDSNDLKEARPDHFHSILRATVCGTPFDSGAGRMNVA
jgi:hypothetical protein